MDFKEFKSYGSMSTATCASQEELLPLFQKAKKEYKGNKLLGITTSSYYFSVYLFLYVLFLCSGAALFSFLEGPEERALKVRITETIQKFLVDHPTVTGQF